MHKKLFIIIIFFLEINSLYSQKDTIVKKDNTQVYQKIDSFSQKNKFYKRMHKLLFRNVKTQKNTTLNNEKNTSTTQNQYEGKIIRNIEIETLDPFGFSANNANQLPKNGLERFGNKMHKKTQKWTIKNILLFKKNDKLDLLLIKESERIIRSKRFARSVVIKTIPIENCADSVDIIVRELDTWSLIPTGSYSNAKMNIELNERNFLGLGHEFDYNYKKRFLDQKTGYETQYSINNILNTFTNISVSSKLDFENNDTKLLKIDRSFYSIYAKWAGGFYYDYNKYYENTTSIDTLTHNQYFRKKSYASWIGRSFKLFKGTSEFARNTNFITSIGYTNTTFLQKPIDLLDATKHYTSDTYYLTTFGINTQKYHQDHYIFRFGTVEDVPYGKTFSITAGIQNKLGINRSYFGGRFAFANYYKFGFFEFDTELGSFFNNGKTEQSTLKFEINYFTKLFAIGKWKFRQFAKPVLIVGNNRYKDDIDKIKLTSANNYGIAGLDGSPVGTSKLLLTLQTQSYNPKTVFGFNFSPYINTSIGFLGDNKSGMFKNKMYSQIGIGLAINNDYLIFNRFQFSFSYYPYMPNGIENVIKTNAIKNSNISFKDFSIGQPYILPYQ